MHVLIQNLIQITVVNVRINALFQQVVQPHAIVVNAAIPVMKRVDIVTLEQHVNILI